MKYIIENKKKTTNKIKNIPKDLQDKLIKMLTDEGFTEKQAKLIIIISINIGWPILIPGATAITGVIGFMLAKIFGKIFLKKKKLDESKKIPKMDLKKLKKKIGNKKFTKFLQKIKELSEKYKSNPDKFKEELEEYIEKNLEEISNIL